MNVLRAGSFRRGLRVWTLGAHVVAYALITAGLAPASAQQPEPFTVRGRVIDRQSAEPIGDVQIFVTAVRSWRSADHGTFTIVARGGDVVTFRRLGYEVAKTTITDSSPIVVRMERATSHLESVVITSARREQRLADAVVATELISRREIEQRGATDVAQAVRDAAGVQAEAGTPSGAGVLLQGLGSRRVLILIDGQPIVGRINGNLDLSRLSTTNVERIEIVKGPQATLYGSDAMGGVINVITRRPERRGLEAELSAIAGSQDRRDISANARMMSKDRRFLGTVDGGSRSIDLVPGRESSGETFATRYDIAPALTWKPAERLAVDVAGSATSERQRYRLGQLYQHSDNVQLSGRVGTSRVTRSGRFAAIVYASTFDHLSRRSTTPLPASHDGDRDEQRLVKLDLASNYTLGRVVVDAGIDARREDARSDRVPGGRRVLHTVEPYTQGTVNVGALSLTPGVRVSVSEQWGTALTPKAAVLWRPRTPLAFRAAVASGYRAPDFKELFLEFVNVPAGYAVRGNPDLQPEHSANLSGSVEWFGPQLNATLSGFHTRFRHFIEARETATFGEYTYDNVDRGRTSGAELAGSIGTVSRSVDASYAWLRATDANGNPLLGRATHAARLGATIALGSGPRFSITSAFNGTTPVARDVSGAITRWRASHTRVDARMAHRLGRRLDVGFAVENVLDRRADEGWPGFSGRMWSVSARVQR